MAFQKAHLCGIRPLFVIILVLFFLFLQDVDAESLSFEQCGTLVQRLIAQGNSTVEPYLYKRRPEGLRPGHTPPLLITLAGCNHFCGSERKYYPWSTISDTITTWVLPLAGGLILQAPFESTQWISTILVLSRWLGNPISVLTCILWNVRTTRKCAQLCDMAVPRRLLPGYGTRSVARQMKGEWSRMLEESVKNSFQEEGRTWPDLSGLKGEERDTAAAFAELRDSLYILCVLNQYAFDHDKPEEVKALLNKALFYRSPVLIERRKKLAASLRCARKHGVVQVLISLLWFLVALIISIYKAFGELGDESTALNLALGLLCGWLPAIIASSLVDQNPSNTFVARAKLQKFLDRVTALDPERYSSATLLMYCGQARRRWHYGCAYAILTDFQTRLKSRERGLVQYYQNGRVVDEKLGDAGLPLWAFNPVEFWQMLSAIFLVGSATMGAVVISFNTPTVGLGCRSGSYLIYGLIATVGFVVEIAGWTALRPRERNPTVLRRRTFVGIRAFLVLLELCNCAWLTFSVIAQTWGIWNTCECRSSNWVMGRGGYLDFGTVETFQTDYIVLPYWIAGTVLGMLPLIAVFTIVYQWCTQSFLGTEDYDKAMRGLRRVRAWKYVFHLSFLHQLTTFGPDKVRSKSLGREFKSVTWTR